MRFELTHEVRGIEPSQATAWWADFQEGRHDHGFFPGADRIIETRDGPRVTMRDETHVGPLVLFRETTTAWPDGDGVSFEGVNAFAVFTGHYGFERVLGGTRIRLVADVHLRPALDWAPVLSRPVIAAILRADLRGHAHDMEAQHARPTRGA